MTALVLGALIAIVAVVLVALPFIRRTGADDDALDAPNRGRRASGSLLIEAARPRARRAEGARVRPPHRQDRRRRLPRHGRAAPPRPPTRCGADARGRSSRAAPQPPKEPVESRRSRSKRERPEDSPVLEKMRLATRLADRGARLLARCDLRRRRAGARRRHHRQEARTVDQQIDALSRAAGIDAAGSEAALRSQIDDVTSRIRTLEATSATSRSSSTTLEQDLTLHRRAAREAEPALQASSRTRSNALKRQYEQR